MVEVMVDELLVDKRDHSPVVVLKEVKGERKLPIWIGPAEAYAIALELSGTHSKRPLTHDLFKNMLVGLGAEVIKVVVSDVAEGVFYGELFVQSGMHIAQVDARPSDCIALALRTKAPIYVSETVMGDGEDRGGKKQSAQDLRDRLQEIAPEDFGQIDL